jgi:hypothetical protein
MEIPRDTNVSGVFLISLFRVLDSLPRYMVPEFLSGEEYNLKADVYTFAIVVWQMFLGGNAIFLCQNQRRTRVLCCCRTRSSCNE